MSKTVVIKVPTQIYEQENADELHALISQAQAQGAQHVELDFSACTSTSAYALNIISTSHQNLRASGGSLKLANIRSPLGEILSAINFELLALSHQ
jgi:hypothetical protein